MHGPWVREHPGGKGQPNGYPEKRGGTLFAKMVEYCFLMDMFPVRI